ncbi:MAG: hypothetical protein KAX40_05495 [Herpetosiphon sp.]|nr:hypothetical protein [Herpetosiphon sp.]
MALSSKYRKVIVFFLTILVSLTIQNVFAWQVSVQYGHTNRFGGEADSGWHRGQVEFANGNRLVRAGDDYVVWTQAQVAWIKANSGLLHRPGMVYHAFARNSNDCGDIRIANVAWSWSNLPNYQLYTKKAGCWTGNNNEIRFLIYGYNNLLPNTNYYFQHLFKDELWTNTGVRGTGKITTDTYWESDVWVLHEGVTQDYHGVFCVPNNNDIAFAC